MPPAEARYPMMAVARLTGLTPDTIRSWERRHGVVSPIRTGGGQRLYSAADVERLRLLRRVVDAGHAIREVAGLDDLSLHALLRPPGELSSVLPLDVPEHLAPLLGAVVAYDHAAVDRELARLSLQLAPRRFVLEAAAPLLGVVGAGWRAGRLAVGHEHLVSGVLRSLLGGMLRLAAPRPGRPPLVLATPPGERHELGALMVGLLAAERGVPVCWLGPDLPAADVAAAATQLGARAVGLGLVLAPASAEIDAAIVALDAALPPDVALWLGGPGVAALSGRVLPARARRFDPDDPAGLEAALDALAAAGGRP